MNYTLEVLDISYNSLAADSINHVMLMACFAIPTLLTSRARGTPWVALLLPPFKKGLRAGIIFLRVAFKTALLATQTLGL